MASHQQTGVQEAWRTLGEGWRNWGLYSELSGYVPVQPLRAGRLCFSIIRLPVRHHTLAFSLLTSTVMVKPILVKPVTLNGFSFPVKPFLAV